ncbi:ectonucleoside triphosphate diphosphohydrolase 2 isoform X2 [Brachyhypopomus gauderio]|uniref:ectonucleoside triphosphate diphosphohydrolase 2 isoform X2 n=1 Tax=Brachyhypopomus gauderio TaxID=698409 RepID=UPI004040FF31
MAKTICCSSNRASEWGRKYGIVLDAGSSHTAMYIYKWPADKQNGTGIVSQDSECHVNKGISSYAGQRGGAAGSLEECMNEAVKSIPKNRHRSTPVYLGATAGMRLLTLKNATESDEILREVEEKLRTYPFDFKGASILTGQMEGAYGWITVNYLSENFIKYGFVGHWLSPNKPTVGALDFGGASTQITFQTADVENIDNKVSLQLYGRSYQIYTHSFLCYGKDQMLRKLLAQVVKNQDSDGVFIHPCYPKDYNVSKTLDKLFDSPCTSTGKPVPFNSSRRVHIQGSGNHQQCLGNISQIFSFESCSYPKCSFNNVYQPKVTGSFMAFSAFYYAFMFLKQTTGIFVNSPMLLEKAADRVCNMTFSEMLDKVPEQKIRLHDYCATSLFMQVLILKGYGFDELTFPGISFQKKAGDASVGWALGYMLSQSNLIPSESLPLRKALRPGAWTALIFLLTSLLVIALAFLLYFTCKNNKSTGL